MLEVDAVFVISHPSSERLNSAMRTAEFLATRFDAQIEVILEQPDFRASRAPQAVLLLRTGLRKAMERRTIRVLDRRARSIAPLSRVPATPFPRRVDVDLQRRQFIEGVLYQKHLDAWRNATKQGLRGFIVIEDDAVLRPESGQILDGLQIPQVCDYLDLAGGFTPEVFKKFFHITRESEGIWSSVPPITNTTCGYWVAGEFAARLLGELSKRSVMRLPIDWALNAAFDRVPGAVFHASPTVLVHGSMNGGFRSDIR